MSLSEVVGTTNDIFLSYSSADRDVVRNVARRLREAGVKVWFDKDSLRPGSGWQDELATQLMDSRACAVFVGPDEIVGWKRYEMEVALDRSVRDRDFHVFPVLLPGIEHFDASVLPPFLATRQWVDLRAGPESAEAIQDLINAMRGVARQIPAVVDGGPECPYRGLEVFEEEHAPYFFGRGAQAQRLVESLRQGRFVAVIGQSGVGKSSLVRAGLLPRIRAGALPGSKRWRVLLIRPGPLPMTTLSAKILALNPQARTALDKHGTGERMLNEAVVVALADEAAGSKLVIVVDQFEEAFALCHDTAERRAFLENLHYAATFPHGPVVVVVTLRADFYPRLAEFPAFAQLAQSHHVLVPQLGNQELRDVILEPAYKVGLTVEQGLADTILGDVVRDPGTLPLLEHALLETWGHRRGAMLTLEGYRATGGVQHALGERAETVYAGLSDAAQKQAGYVFLRLIQPGEGTEDTRRRVSVNEITTGDDAAAEVIRQFVDAWLLTTNADEATGARWVEISHEAVITGWARCARWVEEDRAGLIVHRRLTQAAEEWERQARSADALYRGVPLAEALAWRDLAPDRLNRWEDEFLDAATDVARAQRRSRRRSLMATFAALITALVVIAVVAVMAVARAHIATSRQLAAEANDTLSTDPALSVILALRALDTASTSQAEAVLRQATAESRGRSMVRNPGGTVYSVRLLPDGRRAVSGSRDGAVRLWDLGGGALQQTYPLHSVPVAAAVSPDGQTAASGGLDRTVLLTQLASGQSRTLLTAAAPVRATEFSHDGRLLAVAIDDGTVPVVEVATGLVVRVLRPGGGRVWGVTFNADDTLLATADADGTAQLWRMADGELLRKFDTGAIVYGVAFSPTAPLLAAAAADGKVRIWDTTTFAALPDLPVSGAEVYVVRFSPDGRRLAAGGLDGNIYLWDRSGFALATLRGHAGRLLDLDFDSTGDTLASAGDDGTLRTWATADDVHLRAAVTTAVFNPDGTRIASGGPDGRLREWRTDLTTVLDIPDQTKRSHAVFSADGSRIITYGTDGIVNVRDAVTGTLLTTFNPGAGVIRAVAPDPAGRRLVIGGDDGELVVVDERGAGIETLSAGGSPVYSTVFSPDGRSVLAGRGDGSLTLWGPERQPLTIKPVDYAAVYDTAFSNDGSLIASVDSSGSVELWDRRGKSVVVLHGHKGPVSAVRFGRDGQHIYSSGADGTVRVWDVRTAAMLMTFPDTDGVVSSIDVSPDGTILKSAETQKALRLLSCDVCGPLNTVVDLARPHAFRTLTPDEEKRFAPAS